MNGNQDYILLGNLDLNDAKAVCDVFETKNMGFEIEIDDSAIRLMDPMQAAVHGGTYGRGVTVNIYVDPGSLEQCGQILKEMA